MWRWLYKVASTKFRVQTYVHVLDFWTIDKAQVRMQVRE